MPCFSSRNEAELKTVCFVCVMSLFTVINKHSEMFESQNSVCVLTAVTLALPELPAASR